MTTLRTVLVLIFAPAVLALSQAASFHLRHRNSDTIVSSRTEREYLLHVPERYDRSRPTSLVITMHGGSMWPAAQAKLDGWRRVADEHGFIVVYPSAMSGRGPRAWAAGVGPRQAREVRFISDLIDTLSARYNIDATRIYANGLSNGGGMAFALSCALGDRIAAIGLVAPAIFMSWSACADPRPVPMIVFHGTADPVTRYHGGKTWVAPIVFPDIPRFVATWARRNGCAPSPVDSSTATDVSRRRFIDCANGASVDFYTIEGGGHTWPGGTKLSEWFAGVTSNGVDASEQMWQFFHANPWRVVRTAARPR